LEGVGKGTGDKIAGATGSAAVVQIWADLRSLVVRNVGLTADFTG
jgi:hypothetical protein